MPPICATVRIVTLSDTHATHQPSIPPGDILLHAGDLTQTGTYSQLYSTLNYLTSPSTSAFQARIIVAGNHDVTLDSEFYSEYGGYFHHKRPQDAKACRELVRGWPGITYLEHESTTIKVRVKAKASIPDIEGVLGSGGEREVLIPLKIFGSPHSPAHALWAFSYAPETASSLWSSIPLDADIVVAHTPPKFHRDESGTGRGSAGCEELRKALWRVRPRLVVCGHIHEGRGAEIVKWDLGSLNVRFKEMGVRAVGKEEGVVLRINLMSAEGGKGLQNDGAKGDLVGGEGMWKGRGTEVPDTDAEIDAELEGGFGLDGSIDPRQPKGKAKADASPALPPIPTPPPRSLYLHRNKVPFPNHAAAETSIPPTLIPAPHLATLGQGGPEGSGRCDREALEGRRGRMETCIVNAAVVGGKGNWSGRGRSAGGKGRGTEGGGSRGGGAFVVDLEVDVREEVEEEGEDV